MNDLPSLKLTSPKVIICVRRMAAMLFSGDNSAIAICMRNVNSNDTHGKRIQKEVIYSQVLDFLYKFR